MFLDSEVRFNASTGYSPTATGDNIFPNVVDTSPLGLPSGSGGGSGTNTGRDLGVGSEMWLEILVTAAVTSAGAAEVKFVFATDSSSTLANVVTSTNVGCLMASGIIPKATLITGYLWRAQLPAVSPSITNPYKRYIGVCATITTNTLSAGTFDAKLVKNIQESDLYQSGFVVA